ncbi:DUF2533 family protein [Fictibacillus sp. FJAT-27399]|uniref:DUF2533 family protein n=1 Tax=Fictibacillus sp. FJAT-27399 TaxID=1729689 RepID=UPI00078393E2|nr:DUF2533 family protein [Fictibacillus sp. FJAT-27399]
MSVHQEISKHSSRQHAIVSEFLRLEQRRENLIDIAVEQCGKGLPFSVKEINEVSKQMNQLAQKGIVPQRKLITEQMVKEYAHKKNQA